MTASALGGDRPYRVGVVAKARPKVTDDGRFDGFGAGILEFYEGLAADNSKSYWAAHKPFYDSGVARPLRLLADELEPEFGEVKVMRPHRDIRFAADKSPYKVNASLAVWDRGNAYYLEVSARGVLVAGGMYEPARDQLTRFRQLQDEPLVAADLDRRLEQLTAAGYPLGDSESLVTAPRGWSADHPRIDLLRRKRLEVGRVHPPGPWLTSRDFLDVVTDGWRVVGTWNAWLARHVGPATPA